MDQENREIDSQFDRDPGHRELGSALHTVEAMGGAHLSDAISPNRLSDLLTELDGGPFVRQQERYKSAEQYVSSYQLSAPFDGCPAVARLAMELTSELRSSGIAGTERYEPTEATVMNYRQTEKGITPHLDERRFEIAVAVYTLRGSADFAIVKDRQGDDAIASWRLKPGSLVLLRAPGFGGEPDGRVLHQVGGSHGESRISLGFRMETNTSG